MLIYHIDDNELWLKGVKERISEILVDDCPIELVSFIGGQTALLAIQERGPDVLIQDLYLLGAASSEFPGVSQASLNLMRMAAARDHTSIIILSNHPGLAKKNLKTLNDEVRRSVGASKYRWRWLTKDDYVNHNGRELEKAIGNAIRR